MIEITNESGIKIRYAMMRLGYAPWIIPTYSIDECLDIILKELNRLNNAEMDSIVRRA